MRLAYVLFVLLVFSGCKQGKNSEKEETQQLKLVAGCYGYTQNGTSITFRITRIDPLVQGTLIYEWAEKDRNSGSFEGVLDNDKITGTYIFLSEGMESSREVVFKIKGNQLLEGSGEVTTMGDKVTFKDDTNLDFSENFPLTIGECTN